MKLIFAFFKTIRQQHKQTENKQRSLFLHSLNQSDKNTNKQKTKKETVKKNLPNIIRKGKNPYTSKNGLIPIVFKRCEM
jgi:hypothetical protein